MTLKGSAIASLLLLLALMQPHAVRAEEEARAPVTPEAAAAKVQAAFAADDSEALKALAAEPQPDPWLVVDALCAAAQFEAAAAFAALDPRPDTQALPAYVALAKKRATEMAAARANFAEARTAVEANNAKRVVELLDPPADGPVSVVHVLSLLGRASALRALGQAEEADAAIIAAAAAAERLGWVRRASEIHDELGKRADASGNLAQGLAAFSAAVKLYERRGEKSLAMRARNRVGLIHFYAGDMQRAREIFVALLAGGREAEDRRLQAVSLSNLALVDHATGNLRTAMANYRRALKELDAIGHGVGAAQTLRNIASLHDERGEYPRAMSVYRRALARFEKLEDARGIAATRFSIAGVLHSLGNFAEALATYQGLIDEQRALGDRRGAADTLSNLSNLYVAMGKPARAMKMMREALAEYRAMGHLPSVAATLTNIGVVHEAQGEFEEALAVQQQGLEVARRLGQKLGIAYAVGNVGGAYMRLGRYDEAIEAMRESLSAMKELRNRGGQAWVRQNIGVVYAYQGKFDEAQVELQWSVREAHSLRATPMLLRSLSHLARVQLTVGDNAAALSTATRALESTEDLLGGLGEELAASARAGQARVYATGTLAAAREGNIEDLLLFLESGRAGALLDALGKRELLRWKAESLSDELRDADAAARAAETAARRAYDLAAARGLRRETRAALAKLDLALEAVRDVTGRIQRALKQQAGLFYPRAETLDTITGALEADEVLVLYGLSVDTALALVVEPDGARIVPLGSAEAVLTAAAALDATAADLDADPALARLRAVLVEPLGLKDVTKRVLISPEGALCYLPFGALFERTVTMTPSGTTHVLLLDEERGEGTGILALGDPDYGGISDGARKLYHRGRPVGPLPATRHEAAKIGTTTLLGKEASETGLYAALAGDTSWRAVHFACHGLVDTERPMLSSLALSPSDPHDGFLTASEVLRLRIPTDLAVLSACETGKGKLVRGEGIVGLTRSFMFAGAGRVLCSLWKVDDEATQALMLKFYELWAPEKGGGLSAAAALQQAQQHIRAQPKWKHPYYWAAWVLWGLSN